MTMMTRLARLVRADLNAVLDRLEAPDLVLSQAVRDMEQALDEEHRGLAGLDRELDRLGRRELALAGEETRCTAAITAGLLETKEETREESDRDALLRPLIRRRLEIARHREVLGARAAEVGAERARLAARAGEHAARLDDLRARAALASPVSAQGPADAPTDPDWRPAGAPWGTRPQVPVAEAEIEIELLRLRRQAKTGGGA